MKNFLFGLFVMVLGAAACRAASASTLNFEQYGSGTSISRQYPGVRFSGAVEETASRSEAVYRPHSGSGFLTNKTGPTLGAKFSRPQRSVSGYYSAASEVTVVAYGIRGNVLSREVLPATSGRDGMWSIETAGISKISFTAPTGTLQLDDLSYAAPVPTISDPEALLLFGAVLCSGAGLCVYRAARVKRAVLEEAESAVECAELTVSA